MPLRDHFHDPLNSYCPFASVHSNWSVKMVDRLNEFRLTERFLAQSERTAADIEIDVATLEQTQVGLPFTSANGGVATATEVYAPPEPPLVSEVAFSSSDFEVKIYRGSGWNLVAAVELVSETNKDREESRHTFATKCASYLQSGVSVVVVDAVTTRSAELHNDLCDQLDVSDSMCWTSPTGLAAIAYRVVRNDKDVRLDAWP